MRFILWISCAVLLVMNSVLSRAQTAGVKPALGFEQELIGRQKDFLQAAKSGDAAALSRAVADGFRGIGINGDFYEKSEIVDSVRDGRFEDARAYDFLVLKLNQASAVVTYNLIVPGDHPRYRHMADTWAKIGGQWQLMFRQFTPNLWSATDTD